MLKLSYVIIIINIVAKLYLRVKPGVGWVKIKIVINLINVLRVVMYYSLFGPIGLKIIIRYLDIRLKMVTTAFSFQFEFITFP